MPTTAAIDIDSPYHLTREQVDRFNREGFIKLKAALSPEAIEHYAAPITEGTLVRNKLKDVPMEQRTTYQKAFIQVANLWREDEAVREFCFGKRLARIAAELMRVSGVRMYHDQALYKEPGGGFTPWHADQQYWPLATDRCVTAWVPLQETPREMGPLAFAVGSHTLTYGRDLPISDESERKIQAALKEADFPIDEGPFELGEVSFHLGWTFHRAGPNHTDQPRRVMTIIYMDEHMTLKEPDNANQRKDWEVWCPGAKVGEVIDTPLNPVIYSASR